MRPPLEVADFFHVFIERFGLDRFAIQKSAGRAIHLG
jgi:hypothetical protein